jgi:hypothetical protein
MILNGNDTMIGGSIIIPIDMRTDATTMSMTRNGMNRRKPISNARDSSLIMNAGTRARSGVSSGVGGVAAWERSMNSRRSRSRTVRNMNAWTGRIVRSKASCSLIS